MSVKTKREKMYCKLFGRALRKMRIELTGKSGLLFADENDIPRATYNDIETGKSAPTITTMKKIIEGFNMNEAEFYCILIKNIPQDFRIFDDEHY